MDKNFERLTNNSIMPVGNHKGKPMIAVPSRWLWMNRGKTGHPAVEQFIEENIEDLENEFGKRIFGSSTTRKLKWKEAK